MIYLLIGIAIGLILALFIILKLKTEKQEINNRNKEIEELMSFKKNADRVKIDFNEIEIKSNSWSEETVVDHSKYGGYNQIIGRGDLNIETTKYNENVLLIMTSYNNTPIKINYYVSMDLTTLKMKLVLQKETTLYINPNNIEEYYLDMGFLD